MSERERERAGKKEVMRKEESRLDRDIGKGESWEERKLVGLKEKKGKFVKKGRKMYYPSEVPFRCSTLW